MEQLFSFVVLGLIQGLTEFLPVSSTGHLILAREFFGITADHGLAIDAVLQLATALAVAVYFFKDLLKLNQKLVYALIIGTIPAVVIGIFAEDSMATIFRSAELVAYALLAGSAVMLAAEFFSKRSSSAMPAVAPLHALVIGLFQVLALIPGMSRSGMTISGGLFMGLSREAAARFGFLLSLPIIVGSGLKKLFELGFDGTLIAVGPELLLGSVIAFASGLLAIHALLLFVRTQPLYAFIIYRVLLAGLILILL